MFNSTLFGEIKVNQSINQLFNTSSISISISSVSGQSGQSGQSSQSQSQSGTKDTTTETTKDTTETTKDTTETKLKLKEKIGKNKLKKLKKLNDQLLLVNGGVGVGGAPEEVKSTTKKDGHLVADIIPETRREKIAQVIEKNSRTLFVGNLPVDVIEKKNTTLLKSHFCQFGGELESVRFRSLVGLRA